MWPFRTRCSYEEAMADAVDFALAWHGKSFAVIGESMQRMGEPELGIETFNAETEAALCACAYATAAMDPAAAARKRLLRLRADE